MPRKISQKHFGVKKDGHHIGFRLKKITFVYILTGMTKDEARKHKNITLMFYAVFVALLVLIIFITGLVAGLFARGK